MEALLDSIDLSLPGDKSEFIFPPYRLEPQKYVGVGDTSEIENIDLDSIEPNVLRIDPTPPTTMIIPTRDLVTGKIIGFRDIPISTAPGDDTAINRPISGNIDDYMRGSSANVLFTPGGVQIDDNNNKEIDVDQYIRALENGTGLLSTPFSNDVSKIEGEEELPNLPEFANLDKVKATPVPQPTKQLFSEISKTYAIKDTWDVKNFAAEIPNPALTFPYKLDEFQMRSIYRLELNQCVFVSAPTSAGKTVIAQYAIALCRAHKMKSIYTAPVKALSNQKFRDLMKQFGDVGLLTGDVSINKDASCIIMTTEILRSMLYRGADVLRDVECVIFDECHYISDSDRGVVWEESIILMPYHINMVFLSATVPNAKEIADWIGRTKQRMVYLEEHFVRPVPIEHALYTGDCNFYVISKPRMGIDPDNLLKAELSLDKSKIDRINFNGDYWMTFILSAESSKLLPMIVFHFSKKKCEELAENLLGISLLTSKEKSHVVGFCRKALRRLNKEDRELPQIQTIFALLEAGIGVHHSGILPIIKEMVEILFSEGYVKVLFCTSTFGTGINVPARSCAFVSLEKSNGKCLTNLAPSEFVQMSGRAGRRGLDSVGTSIIMCWGKTPNLNYLKTLLDGKVEPLASQFQLKFNMILNLLRVKDIKMTDILRRSLSSNFLESIMPHLKKKKEAAQKAFDALPPIDCIINPDIEDMGGFGDDVYDLNQYSLQMLDDIDQRSILREIHRGRVVYVASEVYGECNGYNVKVNGNVPSLVVISENPINKDEIKGINSSGKEIVFSYTQIGAIFPKQKSLKIITSTDVKQYLSKFNEAPLRWTKIFATSDFSFIEASKQNADCYDRISKSPCFRCARLGEHLAIYNQKVKYYEKIKKYENKIADESLSFKPLLDSHIKVLKLLEYINDDNVLLLKGRVSIEISSCHEILATELLFAGLFDKLKPNELASVCAALVSDNNRNNGDNLIPPTLEETFNQMLTIAKVLEQTLIENQIGLDENWIDKNVNLSLVQAAYEWADGVSFKDIMTCTDIHEGTVVRIITRVSDTLKDMSNAAKIMGCSALADNFEAAIELIKRDIIFASSLYFD